MRISDWSSDVCSADLHSNKQRRKRRRVTKGPNTAITSWVEAAVLSTCLPNNSADCSCRQQRALSAKRMSPDESDDLVYRSEEHTSELQSLMRTSYAVFCLKQKTQINTNIKSIITIV